MALSERHTWRCNVGQPEIRSANDAVFASRFTQIADVFVRAAVPIEGQSVLIVLHCQIELPQPAIQ